MDKRSYYLRYLNKTSTPPQSWYHRAKNKLLRERLGTLPPGSSILDAGCGCGNITEPFTGLYEVHGVDSQEDAVAHCRKNCSGHYVKASLYDLPFEDSSFDCIVCMDVIEHLSEPGRCISQFHRVMKKNGLGIIATVNYDSALWLLLENTWYRFFGGNCKPYDRNVHPSRFTPASLSACVEQSFMMEEFLLKNRGMEMFAIFRKQ